MEEKYDVIVIGGGCAGYPSAMYSKRFNLKTLVITFQRGGLITTTHLVENWPGEKEISGGDLAKKLEEHALSSGVEIIDDNVFEIKKCEDGLFEVKTEYLEYTFFSKAVILATGTKHKHLEIESEKRLSGKGVSYCATCDSLFFKNREVVIVGGGDSSLKETMVLSQNCSRVYLIVRSTLKGEPINIERVKKLENVEILLGEEIDEILGEEEVVGVRLKSKKIIDCAGVFISIGLLPQNSLAKKLNCDLNKIGEIIIDKDSKTNVGGVFACGDVTNANWKQGVVAASEGAIASNSAFEYINKNFK